ncbi:hypothetical protein M0R45_025827 [Rubus argutus]|uniref:Response regulatory domain-containing protein n=1 Tax=Rubus argutus TaxID=59490 RepID=A0AAW1WVV4_RUBAR
MSEKLDCLDHVLAVDDSPVDRKIIEHLLKISSCKVTAMDNGLKALQFLGLNEEDKSSSGGIDGLKVDMIITDYCMPGMTGYELLKKIKKSSILKDIPVVITSSENILERIDKCLEEGAEDFMLKPLKLSDVKRLKDYMMKDVGGVEESEINKRKLREPSDQPPSPPSLLTLMSSLSSPSLPLSSTSSFSAPSSPTLLDFPILKMNYSD